MRIALGFKPHSGWAALVAVGRTGGGIQVADRRRVELIDEGEGHWAKQPYHAAEASRGSGVPDLVRRGIESARRCAAREVRAAIRRAAEAEQELVACAVLTAEPMPDWTVEEILAVHFRMHQAEGVLFRDALARAAVECKLKLVGIPEKRLEKDAERTLGTPAKELRKVIATLGKTVGPPWGKDQKDAALAALVALKAK
jgi:hypothetical protein